MKRLIISIFILITVNFGFSQCDVISNWDFEAYSSCPTTFSQIANATGWFDANAASATYPSADYYNCSYTQVSLGPNPGTPPSGSGYVGLNVAGSGPSNGGAEMIGTFANLCQGVSYTLSFYSKAAFDLNAGNQALFIQGVNTGAFPVASTNYCPNAATTLLTIPKAQVYNTNWTQRTFTFTSPANFNALIIGGVCASTDNYYIYIDDFRLQTANGTANGSTITSNSSIPCGGGNATITFNLPTGCSAPYDVTYTVNGVPTTINNINNGHTISVPVPGPGTTTVILTGVVDNNGCTSTLNSTLTFTPAGSPSNPSWTNPSPVCAASGNVNLNSLVTGTAGGTWSGTGVSGSTFNPSSGSQSVTYTVGTSPCQSTQTHTITVLPDVNPSWTNPGTVCASAGNINLNSLITGTGGGTWSGTGVSGNTFNPSSGSQSVTYTVGTNPCQETQTQTITVVPDVNPSWTNPSPVCAAAGNINLNSLITGTGGGTWSGTGVSGNTFNPSSGTQTVTYTVGTNPCQETQNHTITVLPDVDPSWSNPSPVCASGGNVNLNSLITGTGGGTWSGTGVSGNTFNPSSGTQTVTYTVGTSPCQETQNHTITVANPDATWSNPSPVCEGSGTINLNSLITGTAGGSWSGTGVSGNTFDPTGQGGNTIPVTYMVGSSPCTDTLILNIVVNSDDDASFNYAPLTYCITASNPLPSSITTSGGSFSINNGGVINSGTGEIDLGASGVGVYMVYYNTNPLGNPCPTTDSVQITITNGPTAGFSYDGAQYCQDSIDPVFALDPGASSGNYSSLPSGLSLNPTNGGIDLSNSLPGVYTVYNNVPAGGGCAAVSDSTTIEILQVDSALFGYATLTYCLNDTGALANISGTQGGVFSISSPGVINSTTGQVDISSSGAGTYMVYYNTTPAGNPCPAMDSVQLTIVPQNTIAPNPIDTICLGDTIMLTATSSGAGTITWYSDAAGTNVIGTGSPLAEIPTTLGTHVYYVREDGPCPSNMDSIVVEVRGVTAQINATPITGPTPLNVLFGNGSTTGPGIVYWWDLGTGDTSSIYQPSYTYNDEGVYTVVLIVTDGMCFATDTITIETLGESSILIPNVFTPNGDGSNDVFKVDGVNLKSVNCEIYNRWGQMMYSWDNVKGYWDGRTLSGTEVPDGTYFYIIKAEGHDGEEYFKKGGFSLIR